jgi:hypothetical protein
MQLVGASSVNDLLPEMVEVFIYQNDIQTSFFTFQIQRVDWQIPYAKL